MLRSLVSLSLLAATPAAVPPASTPVQHSGMFRGDIREIEPPQRFEGDNVAIIVFGGRPIVEGMCGKPNAQGVGPLACTGTSKSGNTVMVVPNPCAFATLDVYAAILCHELGHVNGWPARHGP